MDEKDYYKLLDVGIEQIPEDVKTTERWEIPTVDIEYEGKTTIIKNWRKIIEQIHRDEKHLFKQICKELGAAGDIQHSSGRAVLKSIIKKSSLNKQIANYCKEYVICSTCGKPDTDIIKDGRNHVLKCQACGTRRIIKL
ncbi:MAG: translation initiation factor IF-2 subunit beta [Candidatus Lokiarchaeota archaeon]|nr:translation initiation factor IF-2 subunit beta [Candidatus Lokiarchaeota archaeon]